LPPNPVQSCHPHRSAATRGRLGVTQSHWRCQDSDHACSSVAGINRRRVQGFPRSDLAQFGCRDFRLVSPLSIERVIDGSPTQNPINRGR
jgi:hypothetical protein